MIHSVLYTLHYAMLMLSYSTSGHTVLHMLYHKCYPIHTILCYANAILHYTCHINTMLYVSYILIHTVQCYTEAMLYMLCYTNAIPDILCILYNGY